MADNTFATARNLGFLERGGTRTIQVKDALGSSDRADVFKFTIQPGDAFKIRSSSQTQGGKMNFSFFVKNPISGQIAKLAGATKISGKRSTDIPVRAIPAGAPPLDCYIAFDKPTQNVKYQFKLTSL
ncbi:MAG: hypothetical protein HC772_13225 [Leptolyngbyaceae cyanobacterium CRU_2_3]|nr:hypothetical protein [Leptolyngbyaceae cyanobacterium CRU_2_3]